jgi:hypothetical protein
MKPQTFSAALVRLEIKNRILRELALLSNGQAVEESKHAMAQSLAAFLVKNFVTETKTDQHIELRLGLELLLPTDKVPEGVARTEIIFQAKDPT